MKCSIVKKCATQRRSFQRIIQFTISHRSINKVIGKSICKMSLLASAAEFGLYSNLSLAFSLCFLRPRLKKYNQISRKQCKNSLNYLFESNITPLIKNKKETINRPRLLQIKTILKYLLSNRGVQKRKRNKNME